MLENEGFSAAGYVDIFDGGPTMSVPTDQIRTIRESRQLVLGETREDTGGTRMMVASGQMTGFSCCYGRVAEAADGTIALDSESAKLLGIAPGDSFLAMGR
jgi:arginine N-succinyltransferase